jgi:hypothetical protein
MSLEWSCCFDQAYRCFVTAQLPGTYLGRPGHSLQTRRKHLRASQTLS